MFFVCPLILFFILSLCFVLMRLTLGLDLQAFPAGLGADFYIKFANKKQKLDLFWADYDNGAPLAIALS